MRAIDADRLLSFIRFDEKVIAPEEHTAEDIIMMIQTAPTISSLSNDPLTLEELREMEGIVYCTPLNDWAKVTKIGILFFGTADYKGWRDIIADYGITWMAYRCKPKEAADGT